MSRVYPVLLLVIAAVSLGCSHEPVDEEVSTESSAFEEARRSSSTSGRPTVFAIERPIEPDFNLEYDWSKSEVEVPDYGLGSSEGWRPANKVEAPAFATGIRDKVVSVVHAIVTSLERASVCRSCSLGARRHPLGLQAGMA
jgi:hypothetical protein